MILFALREFRHAVRTGPLRTFMALSTVSIAMLIFTGFFFASHNLGLGLDRFRSASRIEVFLKEDAAPAIVQSSILELEDVAAVDFFPSEKALEYFRQVYGEEMTTGITDALEGNPFPPFIRVSLAEGVTDPSPLVRRIEGVPGVGEVLYGSKSVERLARVAHALEMLAWGIGILMAVFILMIVINNVRATVHTRKRELEVMRLVGATDGYLLTPFLIEGGVLGLSGSVVGAATVYLAYRALLPQVSYFRIEFLPPIVIACLLILGAAVGALGGVMAARETLE